MSNYNYIFKNKISLKVKEFFKYVYWWRPNHLHRWGGVAATNTETGVEVEVEVEVLVFLTMAYSYTHIGIYCNFTCCDLVSCLQSSVNLNRITIEGLILKVLKF
jgi:hypothetical protein